MNKPETAEEKRDNEIWKPNVLDQMKTTNLSKAITTTKHWIQIALEHTIPFVLAYEAIKGKSKISWTKIKKWSIGYYSRIFSAVPQSLSTTGIGIDWYNNRDEIIAEAKKSNIITAIGKDTANIVYEAKVNIYNVISWNTLFQDIDLDMKLITIAITTGTLVYLLAKLIEFAENYKKKIEL